MIDPHNKRIRIATDAFEDDFFSNDAAAVGTPTGVMVAFLTNEDSAKALAQFLGDDHSETVDFSDAGAMNGFGRRGWLVRFKTAARSVEEIRAFVAKLD